MTDARPRRRSRSSRSLRSESSRAARRRPSAGGPPRRPRPQPLGPLAPPAAPRARTSTSQYCCMRSPSSRVRGEVAGRELVDALEDRVRVGNPEEGEVVGDGVASKRRPRQRREKRLDLGGEVERPVALRVVERLDAEAIAREEQLAALGRPRSRTRRCRSAARASRRRGGRTSRARPRCRSRLEARSRRARARPVSSRKL